MNSFSDYREGSATAEYRAMVDKAAAVETIRSVLEPLVGQIPGLLHLEVRPTYQGGMDYALYSQICHVNLGFGPTREDDAERYEAMLTGFAEKISAETELRRFGLVI